MLFGDDGITIKQLSYLLVSQGFKKCELWDAVDYSMAHHHSKEYRLHVVNGIILKNLIKIGFSTNFGKTSLDRFNGRIDITD